MAPRKDNNNNNLNISNPTAAAAAAAVAEFMSSADNAAAEQKQALYLANAKLCRLVKRCPWMYDRQHPNYAKKHIVDKSWAKIAKDCGDDSVASCKERWRNIRAAFARSINIYKTTCGPNRVKPYYLYNDLQFLIKPMMDAREMMNKDTDDIKSDWEGSALASVLATSKREKDADNSAASVSAPEKPSTLAAEPLSDVEADLNFHDEELELAARAAEAEAELMDVMLETDNEESFPLRDSVATAHNKKHTTPVERLLEQTPNVSHSKPSHDFGHHFSASNDDADAKFLEALLPDMRAMNTRQKIIFKRKIYQSLEEVFETNADFPAVSSTTKAVTASAGPPRSHVHAARAETAPRDACQKLTHSIASLKESELQKLQHFVQNMLAHGAVAPAAESNGRQHPSSTNLPVVTVIPRAQNHSRSQNRTQGRGRGTMQSENSASSRVAAPAAAACNGSGWEQLQPMSVKSELVDDDDDNDDDDDDVNDFE